MEFNRYLSPALAEKQSAFIFGPRKTGKSSFLKKKFPLAKTYDLFDAELYQKLLEEPKLLRELVSTLTDEQLQEPVIVEEIQKNPGLLDEVIWLIENSKAYFILSAPNARRFKKASLDLFNAKAKTYKLYPLIYPEFSKSEFDLLKIFNRGLMPYPYQSDDYTSFLKTYLNDYFNEEIKIGSSDKNLNAFAKILEALAFSNGEIVNYTKLAQDCGLDEKAVKEKYQILIDTMFGYYVKPFTNNPDRANGSPKFYLFDVGIANYLAHRTITALKGNDSAKAFGNYILMELMAYFGLNKLDYQIKFWHAENGKNEVDFVITKDNQPLYAIEVKIDAFVDRKDLLCMAAFKRENPEAKLLVISLDPKSRKINLDGGIEILVLPVKEFLNKLWTKKIFNELA